MHHGRYKQRKRSRKRRSQERVRGHGARAVAWESVDEVVERGLEDCEESESGQGTSDNGRDPVDGGRGSPGENEEAAGENDGPQHHGWEPGFGNGSVAVCLEFSEVVFRIHDIQDGAEEDTDEDREEGEGAYDLVPAAEFLECDGVGT